MKRFLALLLLMLLPLLPALAEPEAETEIEPFTGFLAANKYLWSAPEAGADVVLTLQAETPFTVVGQTQRFYHIVSDSAEGYLLQYDVSRLDLKEGNITAFELYAVADTPLLEYPLSGSAEVGTLPAGRVVMTDSLCRGYYEVSVDGLTGWVPRNKIRTFSGQDLPDGAESMDWTAAVTTEDCPLCGYIVTPDGNEITELDRAAAGTRLGLVASVGDYWYAQMDETRRLVPKSSVRLLGSDIQLRTHRITISQDLTLMDFPDQALSQSAGTVPAGSTIIVTCANRCYLKVTWQSLTGYAPVDGLRTEETVDLPSSEDVPSYLIALDKSTFMAYVFQLGEDGEPESLVMSEKVAIGKRSTPTPSGTFTLGIKRRYVRFPNSYTPFSTRYVQGRYIHGLPMNEKNEHSLRKQTAYDAGKMMTGGCIRCSVAFARWIYFNCPSWQTQVLIVNGGLVGPGVVTPSPTPEPTPTATPAPTPEATPTPVPTLEVIQP